MLATDLPPQQAKLPGKNYWYTGISLSTLYFLLAKLGLIFTTVTDNITLIWPPTGLALFALLVFGPRFWPWVAVGAFAANMTTGIPLLAGLGIATGNTLEAIAGVYLLRLVNFDSHLSRVRDVLSLVFLAAGISTLVSATIGVLSLVLSGVIPRDIFLQAWVTWWMGDAMGDLVFAPLLLSWWLKEQVKLTGWYTLEAIVLFLSLGVVTQFVFSGQYTLWEQDLPLTFMTYPFLIWASLRFGMRGATSTVLLIGSILLAHIILHQGLFSQGSTFQSLSLLWLYTNFLAITSMVLAAAINERRLAEMGMRHLALHDHLTGLPNRFSLHDRIEQAIKHMSRQGQGFALLYIDVDRFKTINDSLGHSVGDEMIKEIGRRLVKCVRKEDTVSRLGGDEFVLLLEEVKRPQELHKITDKIINSIHEPVKLKDSELHTSVSVGICLYPNDGHNAETLLKHADIAMYRAKDMGRDTSLFYSADMNDLTEHRLSIENDLRHAVTNNEFSLHFQPQFDVKSGRIMAAEALLRWCKADGSCIEANEFIPILEESGQIINVGTWVIENACQHLSQWHAAGWDHLRISINLSSLQLNNQELAQDIADILDKYQLPADCLELEITESMLVRHDSKVEKTFEQLVKLGIRLAVDDFGTGYSSLSYLHRLSIDTLKIDRTFIEQVPGNNDSETITRAIVGLGKGLHLTVIAEGVENEEQRNFVNELGCDYIQGFLLSKPLTKESFEELLVSNQK